MKGFVKALSVFLSLLMVLYVIPSEVYGLKTSAADQPADKVTATDNVLSTESTEPTAVGEVLSKRTASTKTVRMSDGSYRLVQYADEVHYKEADQWVEYDNSLTLSASKQVTVNGVSKTEPPVFTTASNPGGLSFGQSAAEKLVSFTGGNNRLEMSVIGAANNSIAVPQTKTANYKSIDKFEEIITIENYSTTVLYTDVFENAHISYTAAGNRVKEDIIVYKKSDTYTYSFGFTLIGLEAELEQDGSITFTDTQTNEIMYHIPVGYMYDSGGAESQAVSYSLTQTNTGCTVTVTADAEWINNTERVFPVVIDPTIVRDNGFLYEYNEIRDTHSYEGKEGGTGYQNQSLRVGKYNNHHYSSYISLFIESGEDEVGFVLPEASVITNATLVLDVTECTAPTTVYMHAITQDWDQHASPWTSPSVEDTATDYQIITSTDQTAVFDFTSVAQRWGKNSSEPTSFYKGFKLSCDQSFAGHVLFASLNTNQANTISPYFVITYRDTKGLDGRWTYNSQSAGGAGTGNVNLFTGNLVFVHGDITTNGNILPLTVSHVYNTHQANRQFTYIADDIHTANYTNMSVGNGFKLSIQETITTKEINNSTWYIYNDADGTELYFKNFNGGSKYISEDGYDLTIVKSNGTYTMSDKVGNTKKFDSSGRLTELCDRFGNKKTISYEDGRITSVSHTPSVGTSTTQLSFTYNAAGALEKITNAIDTSEYATFSYSTQPTGTASTTNAGYLRAVTYSKGSGSCSYDYDSNGRLITAKDTTTGNKLQYEYYPTMDNGYAAVSSVAEYNASSNIGQKVGFTYGAETTSVRTSGNDDEYDTADDLLTCYVFDDQGRTISAYTTNLNGTRVYGASNAEYTPTTQGSKKNHTVTKDSVSGVPAINLLKNHSAETDANWSANQNGNGYSSAHTTQTHYIGNGSFKLTSTATKTAGYADYSQAVTITTPGAYTFSAYVKIDSISATAGFYLQLGAASSRLLKTTTAADIQNGWQRISVTAELTAGTHTVRAVLEKAIGTVYVDCLQLEQGIGTSKYNLVENGGITEESGWTLSGGAGYHNNTLTLEGNPSAAVTASQTIPVTLPITTTFVLSGWSQARSVAMSDDGRAYALKAILNYSDGTTETTTVNFSAENSALQFTSGAVVAKEKPNTVTISSVEIQLCYNNNANTALFYNICLAIEPAQTYFYDTEGNLTSATNADGNQIGAEYYSNQIDLKSYTTVEGQTYNYQYNADHTVSQITRTGDAPITTTYSYDEYGNQTAEVVTNGNNTLQISTGATYDSNGKTLAVTDARGNNTTYSYYNYSELLQYVQTANSARTAYSYDEKYRLTDIYNDIDRDGVKDSNEQYVHYTYNNKDQLTGITTDSTLYTLIYDSFGNNSAVKAGNYTLANYEYNDYNGKLLGTTYGNGFTVTNVYDSLDRLVEVKYNNSTAYTVIYNGSGTVSCINDALTGRSTAYEYDSLGRLIYAEQYITTSGNPILKTFNQYDVYGRPSSSTYTVNNTTQAYTVMYDDQNRTDFFTLNQSLTQWLNIELGYDSLDRLSGRIVNLNGFSYTEQFAYESVTNTSTSSFVTMHTVNGVEYNYVYDAVGNITAIYKDLVRVASYSYDKLGQLTMAFLTADDGTQDVYEYYYDKSGNITNALHHRGDTTQESQYTYGNATWGDLLTKYNGVNISYDAIGNPNNWRNAGSLMWQGRRLALFSHINGEQYMYTYNSDGIRTSKQIRNADNALITGVEYIYDGSKLVAESRNGEWLFYAYDETGAIAGLSYNNTLYFFRKNLQGDVTGIYNANGALIAEYSYTPYGAMLAITDANGNDISGNSTHIANINPIRYRGYYYDTETGFYYLQTRYYDPTVGRFINADAFVSTGQGVVGNNMFAYCGNNPIINHDQQGMLAGILYWFEQATQNFTNTIVNYGVEISNACSYIAPIVLGGIIIKETTTFIYGVFDFYFSKPVSNYTSTSQSRQKPLPNNELTKPDDGSLYAKGTFPRIAKQYGIGECVEAAQAMKQRNNGDGNIIELYFRHAYRGYVVCDKFPNQAISSNGIHHGYLYKGIVYCNIYPYGLPKETWIKSFYDASGEMPEVRIY